MKEEWALRQSENKIRNIRVKEDVDPESCGRSAAQAFVGEDPDRLARVKLQQNQMKRWIEEQLSEKAQLKAKEKEFEANYSQVVNTLDNLLQASHYEEQETRRQLLLETRMSNEEVSLSIIFLFSITFDWFISVRLRGKKQKKGRDR